MDATAHPVIGMREDTSPGHTFSGRQPKAIPGLVRRTAPSYIMMGRSGRTFPHPRKPRKLEHLIVNTDDGRIEVRVDEITTEGHYIGPVTHLFPKRRNATDVMGLESRDIVIVPGIDYVETLETR